MPPKDVLLLLVVSICSTSVWCTYYLIEQGTPCFLRAGSKVDPAMLLNVPKAKSSMSTYSCSHGDLFN